MPNIKADTQIGQRAFEEVLRIFPKLTEARKQLGITSEQLVYDWMDGATPSTRYLQKLYYFGADVIYILSGVRSK